MYHLPLQYTSRGVFIRYLGIPQCFFSQPSSNKTILSIHDPCCHPGGGWPSSIVCKTRLTPCDAGLHPQGEERADRSDLPHRHIPDDISVFDVWHISTADMLFDISARNLSYQSSFGVSARILTYQPGIWRINRARFRHLAYHLAQQWEAVRFDFVKHTGVLGQVQRR